jgi:hypothetical protein
MSDSPISLKKMVLLVGKLTLGIVAALGAMVACVSYINWSAERKATKFCDEIEIGSDVSLAIEKAKQKKIFHSDFPPYNFYFWGIVFDKAVCEVSVDHNRKVTAKHSEMEYD